MTRLEVLALFDEDARPSTLARRDFFVPATSRDGTRSFAIYETEQKNLVYLCKQFGPFLPETVDKLALETYSKPYYIGHIQAPTTEGINIHPSYRIEQNSYLWHNGILKPQTIVFLQKQFFTENGWDTALLHKYVDMNFVPLNIDGTFACVHVKIQSVYVFRNEIAPLFQKGLTFSSTKFDGSFSLKPNVVWEVDFQREELKWSGSFETVDNPYCL